ncbi:MAG TPA: hypothetical protein VG841_11510 [Caulobacterales bacterium]|nr:hypothetical protein [Caulobacterales bacterium]
MHKSSFELRAPVAATARARAERVEARLRRFPKPINAHVRTLAARHARLADLAVSFPALLAALGAPRRGLDAERVIAGVIAGISLSTLAAEAGIPLWLRNLAPEAFATRLPDLPNGALFKRQIANHLPTPRASARWLDEIAFAARWADDAVALWLARELTQPKVKAPRGRRRRTRARRESERERRMLALWAWFSQRPDAKAHALIETPWRPEIGLAHAREAAQRWYDNVSLMLAMGERAIDDAWFEPAVIDGYEFVPLRMAQDVLDEARAMKNCLRTYGASLAEGWSRVWSVRRDRERVATVEINFNYATRLIALAQVRVLDDKQAPTDVVRVVQRWFLEQDETTLMRTEPAFTPLALSQSAWNAMWRPYWLAKRTAPPWLPRRAAEQSLSIA